MRPEPNTPNGWPEGSRREGRPCENLTTLLVSTIEDATLPAAQPDAGPLSEHDALRRELIEIAPFNEAQIDTLAHLINQLRDEWQRDHAVEIAELRGPESRAAGAQTRSVYQQVWTESFPPRLSCSPSRPIVRLVPLAFGCAVLRVQCVDPLGQGGQVRRPF